MEKQKEGKLDTIYICLDEKGDPYILPEEPDIALVPAADALACCWDCEICRYEDIKTGRCMCLHYWGGYPKAFASMPGDGHGDSE